MMIDTQIANITSTLVQRQNAAFSIQKDNTCSPFCRLVMRLNVFRNINKHCTRTMFCSSSFHSFTPPPLSLTLTHIQLPSQVMPCVHPTILTIKLIQLQTPAKLSQSQTASKRMSSELYKMQYIRTINEMNSRLFMYWRGFMFPGVCMSFSSFAFYFFLFSLSFHFCCFVISFCCSWWCCQYAVSTFSI